MISVSTSPVSVNKLSVWQVFFPSLGHQQHLQRIVSWSIGSPSSVSRASPPRRDPRVNIFRLSGSEKHQLADWSRSAAADS